MTKGEKILKHRKILDLSQEDLGNLVKLSRLLNITIDYLLNDSFDSVEPA
jgi:hypothetical protein